MPKDGALLVGQAEGGGLLWEPFWKVVASCRCTEDVAELGRLSRRRPREGGQGGGSSRDAERDPACTVFVNNLPFRTSWQVRCRGVENQAQLSRHS